MMMYFAIFAEFYDGDIEINGVSANIITYNGDIKV